MTNRQTKTIVPGTRLGHYEIGPVIGSGGMGDVYKARDLRLDRTLALKVLPDTFSGDAQFMDRFVQEAKLASSLNHPNILTIYEINVIDGVSFIAMELVEGQTLRDRMPAGLTLGDALDVVIQVAAALAASHAAGVVHRDLKPENIMLRADGYAKVLDFGLAKTFGSGDADDVTTKAQLTRAGIVLGTARYMSPEQARGDAVDGRTDIYSLGVVLFELVAGRAPFEAPSWTGLIAQVIERDAPPLREYVPGVPPDLERIVARMLARDLTERYQSVRDLLADLKWLRDQLRGSDRGSSSLPSSASGIAPARAASASIAAAAGQPSSSRVSEEPARAGPRPRSLRVRTIWAVALVALALAVGVGYRTWSGARSINSIAVLPFTNVGGNPDMEYLTDGITESTIDALAHLPNMRVTARSSVFRYKGRTVDPPQIGRDLAVRAILVGRVTERNGDLAVSVELVDVRDNTRIWGQEYRRRSDDALAIQVAISADIADTLRVRFSPDEHRRLTGSSQNKEAYQLFLKGRYYWNKRNRDAIQQAIGYYQQAIDKDPTYAMAYVGLADCYNAIWVYSGVSNNDAHVRAKAATERALEIDENLAEAYASRASREHDHEWDFPAAERDFKKAIELNPSHATARQWYAEFLAAMGRSEEAIAQIGRAQEVDPLSSIIGTVSGKIYKLAGQYDRAVAVLSKAIESDPGFYVSHMGLSEVYIEKGMFREAIVEYEAALTLAGEPQEAAAERASLLLRAFSTGGPAAYWRERLALARRDIDTKHSLPYRISDASPYHLAALHARLDQRDAMLAELERALRDKEPHLINVMVDGAFTKYRADPKVLEIARAAGLQP